MLDNGAKITEYYQNLLLQEQNINFGTQRAQRTLHQHMRESQLPLLPGPEVPSKDPLSVESLMSTQLDPSFMKPRFIGPDAVDLTSDYVFDLDLLSVPMKIEDFYTKINVC